MNPLSSTQHDARRRDKPPHKRESPLLAPLTPTGGLSRKTPSSRSVQSKAKPRGQSLSLATRARWLREAQLLADATSIALAFQESCEHTANHQRVIDTGFADTPVVATAAELTEHALSYSLFPADERSVGADRYTGSAIQSGSVSPGCAQYATTLPLYARPYGRHSKPTSILETAPASLPPKKTNRFAVAPLLSSEMMLRLQTHLEARIQGDIWQNEIRSRLARPLSATTFCDREEQLSHVLSAPQFTDPVSRDSLLALSASSSTAAIERPALYPFSTEAHAFARRIGRMFRRHCFRIELLSRLRRLAVTIRYFRRMVMPWLVREHRRRKRAAIRIQRRLRRYWNWRHTVLAPVVQGCVTDTIATAMRRHLTSTLLAVQIQRLFRMRRAREEHTRQRRRVMYRWVAKTRVCRFVHQIWCVRWFRLRREANLMGMRAEYKLLEQSDADVRVDYSTIFLTPFGKKLLKKELTQWRQSVKKKPSLTARRAAGGGDDATETVDPAVVRLRQCFEIFDLDGSGCLDLDEFQLMLAYLRSPSSTNTAVKQHSSKSGSQGKPVKLTTAQVRALFDSLDVDHSGSVTCTEFENWWFEQRSTSMGSAMSASVSFLASGIDRLVLTGHGMLFWLLGKQQQLERKFIKKLMVKKATESAKKALLTRLILDQPRETHRCDCCGRRFGYLRDWRDHQAHCDYHDVVLDTFVLGKWIREEEIRLLEEEEEEDGVAMENNSDSDDDDDTKSGGDRN